MKIRVGIFGASGYTGLELVRLLARHPQVELAVISSRQYEGSALGTLLPDCYDASELVFQAPELEHFEGCQATFFAAPAGIAAGQIASMPADGTTRLFDLSADFRLRDASEWQTWYGMEHPCPHLLKTAVYGMPELHRDALRQARIIAVPGCYPTSVLLPVAPLLQAGIISPPLFADCTSGITGAGRQPATDNLFAEIAENYRAYKVSGHRHLPEMLEQMASICRQDHFEGLTFVPHLAPMKRGIFATIHAQGDAEQARDTLTAHYQDEPFVSVAATGEEISVAQVHLGNNCRIAVHSQPSAPGWVILQSVIDNLGKGAAGQAVQCFNLAFDLPETLGLMPNKLI